MHVISAFKQIGLADAPAVGGKGANLGEMTTAGFPVPAGFVVRAEAYLDALDTAGVRTELQSLRAGLDAVDDAALAAVSEKSRAIVQAVTLPEGTAAAIREAYQALGDDVSVAVRSSGTAEDSGETSFAGMNETFTNVQGADAVLERIVDCWASLHGERSIAYRAAAGLTEEPTIAVVVQKMIPSERSGIVFTVDPSTNDPGFMIVEAILGQGEAIVSGMVEPDTYRIHKPDLAIADVRVGRQDREIIRGGDGADSIVTLDDGQAAQRVLDDAELHQVATVAAAIEEHYGVPQDVEWARRPWLAAPHRRRDAAAITHCAQRGTTAITGSSTYRRSNHDHMQPARGGLVLGISGDEDSADICASGQASRVGGIPLAPLELGRMASTWFTPRSLDSNDIAEAVMYSCHTRARTGVAAATAASQLRSRLAHQARKVRP